MIAGTEYLLMKSEGTYADCGVRAVWSCEQNISVQMVRFKLTHSDLVHTIVYITSLQVTVGLYCILRSSVTNDLTCCCPTHGSSGIREVFSCKSVIVSETCRAGLINCDPFAKPMRVIVVNMERRRNEGAGKTEYPRENQMTNAIVMHNSHLQKSGDPARAFPSGRDMFHALRDIPLYEHSYISRRDFCTVARNSQRVASFTSDLPACVVIVILKMPTFMLFHWVRFRGVALVSRAMRASADNGPCFEIGARVRVYTRIEPRRLNNARESALVFRDYILSRHALCGFWPVKSKKESVSSLLQKPVHKWHMPGRVRANHRRAILKLPDSDWLKRHVANKEKKTAGTAVGLDVSHLYPYCKNTGSVGVYVRTRHRPIGPYHTGYYPILYSFHYWPVINQWRVELILTHSNRESSETDLASDWLLHAAGWAAGRQVGYHAPDWRTGVLVFYQADDAILLAHARGDPSFLSLLHTRSASQQRIREVVTATAFNIFIRNRETWKRHLFDINFKMIALEHYYRNEDFVTKMVVCTNNVIDKLRPDALGFLAVVSQDVFNDRLENNIVEHVHGRTSMAVVNLNVGIKDNLREMFPGELVYTGAISTISFVIWFSYEIDERFLQMLKCFKSLSLWNPQAPFVLVQNYFVEPNLREILFRTWEEHHITNLIVICPCEMSVDITLRGKYKICTFLYDQFSSWGTLIKVDNAVGKMLQTTEKMKNIKGYEITLLVTARRNDWTFSAMKSSFLANYECNPIITIFKRINGTLNVVRDKDNFTTSKRDPSIDIYGTLFIKHLKNQMTSSYPVDQTCLKILVPKSERIPQYMNIIIPLSKNLWKLYFCTVLLLVFVWKFVRLDASVELKTFVEVMRIAVTGVTIVTASKTSHRLFVSSCLILSLLTMNAYSGSLTSYLTTPHYYKDMDTLLELDESGLAIAIESVDGVNSLDDIIDQVDPSDEILVRLSPKSKFMRDSKQVLESMVLYRNVSLLAFASTINLFVRSSEYNLDGYPLLHIIGQCPYVGQVVYQYPHRSPYDDVINDQMFRFAEGGFLVKWYADDITHVQNFGTHLDKPSSLKPLSTGHVITSFAILCGGLLMKYWPLDELELSLKADFRRPSPHSQFEESQSSENVWRASESGSYVGTSDEFFKEEPSHPTKVISGRGKKRFGEEIQKQGSDTGGNKGGSHKPILSTRFVKTILIGVLSSHLHFMNNDQARAKHMQTKTVFTRAFLFSCSLTLNISVASSLLKIAVSNHRHMRIAGRPLFVRLEEVIRQHIDDVRSTSTCSIARQMGLPHSIVWDALQASNGSSLQDKSIACIKTFVWCGYDELYAFNVKIKKTTQFRNYTRQKAKSKYRNRISLERASQKQSSDTHKTSYDGVKRCRERKINIGAPGRVNSRHRLHRGYDIGAMEPLAAIARLDWHGNTFNYRLFTIK
ncbi:hypothetical protein PR048_022127 [Dryococelus australis]|uniref:Uncharacterized protein n=1 Tax=Dryococelus australis TaxID=614101 RepID=A0ABQ9H097_9NEOP|nr:hypothetical protein PR048_022127 [Dryococelus australis]